MRAALVIHDFNRVNGQGRYAVELARRLANHCQVEIWSDTADPAVLAEMPRVTWRHVRTWRRRYIFRIFTFLVAAERGLRTARPDLIHAQGLSCWGADIVTVHIVNRARARCLPEGDRRSRRFATLLGVVEGRFYRQRRARHAIVMSQRLAGELREEYGWKRPISVIPHGTDNAVFRPPVDADERATERARWTIPRVAWLWLFVGEAVKGLHLVIEALAAFPGARLLVITQSPPGPWRARAAQRGVEDRLVFAGFDKTPERAYRAADVLVYPTGYESFGMVITEGMAAGLPVIVGCEAGAAELISDGVNGILVDPRAPDAVGAALRRLAADPGLAARLGDRARATVCRYDWDACAEATWQVYQGKAK